MSADDSCEAEPIMRAAIRIKIDQIDATAIVDSCFEFNVLHKNVFRKICEQDLYNELFGEIVDVQLDIMIDGRSIMTVFHVLPELQVDVILGNKFLHSVKGNICSELKLLKWYHHGESVMTVLIEFDEKSEAPSDSCGTPEVPLLLEKVLSEMLVIDNGETAVSASKCSTKKKRKRKSKKTLRMYDTAEENATGEFVKIFIVERELWDLYRGECLAFYGVYSSQKDISFLTGELLNRKAKSPLGYYMEALSYAFGEACHRDVENLHIISENAYAIELMIDYQKQYEEKNELEPKQCPLGLYRCNDFNNYYTACFGIPSFKSIKFECVSCEDNTYPEMVHARKLVEEYMNKKSM